MSYFIGAASACLKWRQSNTGNLQLNACKKHGHSPSTTVAPPRSALQLVDSGASLFKDTAPSPTPAFLEARAAPAHSAAQPLQAWSLARRQQAGPSPPSKRLFSCFPPSGPSPTRGNLPIKHGRAPTKHGRFPNKHGRFHLGSKYVGDGAIDEDKGFAINGGAGW